MQIEIKIVGDTATDKVFTGLLLALGAIADGSVDVTGLSKHTAPVVTEEKPQPKQTASKKQSVEQQVKEALETAVPETETKNTAKEEPPIALIKTSSFTLEAVRAEAVAISKSGKREEVKALITKHGGEKVTDLDVSVYDAFMSDLADLKKAK